MYWRIYVWFRMGHVKPLLEAAGLDKTKWAFTLRQHSWRTVVLEHLRRLDILPCCWTCSQSILWWTQLKILKASCQSKIHKAGMRDMQRTEETCSIQFLNISHSCVFWYKLIYVQAYLESAAASLASLPLLALTAVSFIDHFEAPYFLPFLYPCGRRTQACFHAAW